MTETIQVTDYVTSFGVKNVQKTKFEAAEMILDPWNQQIYTQIVVSGSCCWSVSLSRLQMISKSRLFHCHFGVQALFLCWQNPVADIFNNRDCTYTLLCNRPLGRLPLTFPIPSNLNFFVSLKYFQFPPPPPPPNTHTNFATEKVPLHEKSHGNKIPK